MLYPGRGDVTLPPTPWYLTPIAFSLVMLAVSLGVCVYEWRRKRIVKWWMTLFFSMLGLTGCVVWFLVFISTHDSTSPNLLSLWLNPLQLLPAIFVWWRRTRPMVMAMTVVDLIIMAVLVSVWPFQAQCTSPAVFPLWGATTALCAVYALLYPYEKNV